MADIPVGGYLRANVPDLAAWDLIERFDREYSAMLRGLEGAWLHGDASTLGVAVGAMMQMARTGRELTTKPLPGGTANYGPCFRFVP